MRVNPKILPFAVAAGFGVYVYYRRNRRDISKKGLQFLIQSEGFRNKAYKDVKGLWTIGVGHLIRPDETHLLTATLTDKQVNELLKKDLDRFERVVRETIRRPLKVQERDALIHFAFNIGEAGFKGSQLAKLVNDRARPEQIIWAFSQWRTPSQLIGRRAKEARLFLTGNYSSTLPAADYDKYFQPVLAMQDCSRCMKLIKLGDRAYYLAAA